MKNISLIIVFVLLLASTVFAQLDSVAVYLQKGNKGLVDKRYDYAEMQYKEVLRLDKTNFEAIKNLGIIYSSTGRGDIAGEYLERAYKMNKTDHYLCNALGAFYSERKNNRKAIGLFNEAVLLDPENDIYHYNLGNEYLKVGDFNRALASLKKAFQIEPNKLINNVSLGQAFAAVKQNDSAEVYFVRSLAGDTTNSEIIYYIAMAKQDQNKINEAIDYLHLALKYHDNHLRSLQALGTLYLRQNKFDSATTVLQKAVELNPKQYSSLIQLGASYALLNNNQMADSVYLELLKVDSSYAKQMIGIIQSIKTYQLK